jgi:S-adenosylmethionine decarboxylase
MAYDDALFQLGMDLTRSSTAQKEDHGNTAPVAHTFGHQPGSHDNRKDFFIERDGVRYAGNHLIVDLFGAKRLGDLKHIERTLKRCVEVSGATLLHVHLHHFTPNGGVSGVAVLAESHISIHSWPEAEYAALDIFMCGDAKAELAVPVLREAFAAREVVVKTHRRGEAIDRQGWQGAAPRQMAPVSLPKVAARSRKAKVAA